jgi:hypothetical protein
MANVVAGFHRRRGRDVQIEVNRQRPTRGCGRARRFLPIGIGAIGERRTVPSAAAMGLGRWTLIDTTLDVKDVATCLRLLHDVGQLLSVFQLCAFRSNLICLAPDFVPVVNNLYGCH